MNNWSERYIPLVVSVGQVAIFPYYILWLKEASLTFTLFTWLFAAFSFSAALSYGVIQSGKMAVYSYIPFIYIGMGSVYMLVGLIGVPSGKCGFTTLSTFSRRFPHF